MSIKIYRKLQNYFFYGHDKSGREMPTGVYYYLADVQLKYSQEKTVMKQIKGWVHLIR